MISDRATRLFGAMRDEAVEITDHRFPFTADIVPTDRRAVAGRFALPSGGDDSEQQRAFYRTVDRALAALDWDDPLPLILAGVRTSTGLFEATSRNAAHVIGRLDGAHDTATAHEIGGRRGPPCRRTSERAGATRSPKLADAVNAGQAVTGMDEAWQLGRVGRGRLLVVEEDYRDDPAREVDGRLVAPGIGERDVIADPVDELIEHVVRAGGTPEFVAPGALEEYGRIGLILR